MKQFIRKYKKPISAISALLAILLVVGVILNLTGRLTETKHALGIMKPNTANLLDVDDYDAYDGTTVSGVKITVNDDGSITLDGTATAAIVLELADEDFGTIVDSKFVTDDAIYQAHTYYTYSCTNDNSKIDSKMGITAVLTNTATNTLTDNNKISFINNDNGYHVTETVNVIDNISIVLNINSGTILDEVTFYPVVNEGITAEPFFIG